MQGVHRIGKGIIVVIVILGMLAVNPWIEPDVHAVAWNPAKVTGVKITTTESRISLKWKKAARAKKYYIQIEQKKGEKWKLKKTLRTKKTVCSCAVKMGYTYRVRVRGVAKKKGKWSAWKKAGTYKSRYLMHFLGINEIGNTFGDISHRYALSEVNCTDNWHLFSCSNGLYHQFGIRSNGDETTQYSVADGDKCKRMSGRAKDLFGLGNNVSLKAFSKDTGVDFGYGSGMDLETISYTGQSGVLLNTRSNCIYNVLFREVSVNGTITPETKVDIEELNEGKPAKIQSRMV